MRIIAGKFRGRRLAAPPAGVRPTSDRLRETLFDVLAAALPLAGTRWLDLYAGTGAVGIEAISRGAAHVTFVETSRSGAAAIRSALKALAIERESRVLNLAATKALALLAKQEQQFDICFLDPPYVAEDAYKRIIENLAQLKLMTARGLIIAEHSKRFLPPEECGGFKRFRLLRQGDAALSFYALSVTANPADTAIR